MERPKLTQMWIAAPLLLAAWWQPVRPVRVSGPSMEPAFTDGEWLVGTKVWGRLEVDDVVVFRLPSGETALKRVAAVEGDVVLTAAVRQKYRVNAPQYTYTRTALNSMLNRGELSWTQVPAGTVYVVGDNVLMSTDSRSFGPIPVKSVLFKVTDPRRKVFRNWMEGRGYGTPAEVGSEYRKLIGGPTETHIAGR